jgi:hypothetical protein
MLNLSIRLRVFCNKVVQNILDKPEKAGMLGTSRGLNRRASKRAVALKAYFNMNG